MPDNMPRDHTSSNSWENWAVDTTQGKKKTSDDARNEAQKQVQSLYPHAVYRDRQDIFRSAEQAYQPWLEKQWRPDYTIHRVRYTGEERWKNQVGEQKRLYVSAFVSAYQEALAVKDEAARPKVQPQPQPPATPATPSNTLTIDGATFTVRKIDRSADEIVYYLEINHPGVTDGVEVLPLAHSLSNVTSSSSFGYAVSFSDVTPSSSTRQASSSSDPGSSSKFSINKASKFYIKR